MANHKRKAGYKQKRSCGLCKPWKRVGNSRKLERRKPVLSNSGNALISNPLP